MTNGTGYVLAAYLVVLAVVLGYLVIYAFKLARLGREVEELADLARRRGGEAGVGPPAEPPADTAPEAPSDAPPARIPGQ